MLEGLFYFEQIKELIQTCNFTNAPCHAIPTGASDSSTTEASGRDIDEFRDQLATAIALGW